MTNEKHKKVIEDLEDKVKKVNEGNSTNSNVDCEHEEMKEMTEKVKELRNTHDLKIKKLKEQHLEEINEVKIQNLRSQEELSSAVKEKQRLKESERILVETFDTLKTFYEKPQASVHCRECGVTCTNEVELNKHREAKHNQVFACVSCTFVSKSKNDFEKHLSKHNPSTERTMYECEVCGIEGFNKSVIEKHMEKMHTCLECKTVHQDLYELNRHKEKEHTQTEYKCAACDFVTKSESDYKAHLSEHEKAKYVCEVCGKKANSQDEIDEHIQSIHVKEMFQHFVKRHERRNSDNKSKNRRDSNTSKAKVYSYEERKNNGYCMYWNKGGCSYGEFCRFSHEESPECRFQDQCFRKSTCKFFHHDQSFLEQGRRRQSQF